MSVGGTVANQDFFLVIGIEIKERVISFDSKLAVVDDLLNLLTFLFDKSIFLKSMFHILFLNFHFNFPFLILIPQCIFIMPRKLLKRILLDKPVPFQTNLLNLIDRLRTSLQLNDQGISGLVVVNPTPVCLLQQFELKQLLNQE